MNNAVTICTLLAAAAVVSVSAYDFKDSEFNQILALKLDDFYNYNSPKSHPRARRDDGCRPPRERGPLCCGEDLLYDLREKESKFKQECFEEVFKKEKPHKIRIDPFTCESARRHRKNMGCIAQCVGQKQGMLDSDGNLKEEEFASFLKENFASESWLVALQDEIISTCQAEAKNATAGADGESCNSTGIRVVHCLFKQIQLNCPADQIEDKESCSKLQEKLRTKSSFLPPPPPDDGPID